MHCRLPYFLRSNGRFTLEHKTMTKEQPKFWSGVDFDIKTLPPLREWLDLTEEDFAAINQSCQTKLQAAALAEIIIKDKNMIKKEK